MLLTLLLFARNRDLLAGLAAGFAAITRPEMLAVAGLLAAWRFRTPKRAIVLLLGFCVVYAFNVGVFYRSSGQLLVLPKTSNFMARSQVWTEREQTLDEALGDAEAPARPGAAEVVKTYLRSAPKDLIVLARHATLVILALAVFGAVRRPSFLLLAVVPLLAMPVFAPAARPRFFLPYLPILILYAFIGVDRLKGIQMRRTAMVVTALAAVAGVVSNRDRLMQPEDEHFVELKEAGLELRDRVRPGDKLADRKPHVAFYSGARYVEIPQDNYNATIEYLVREDVRFVSLFFPIIDAIRPVFSRLITDKAVVLGELRYKQTMIRQEGLIVYERTGVDDPLRWERISEPDIGAIASLAWSPDGERIAFVRKGPKDGAIYSLPAGGGAPPRLLVDTPGNDGHPAWSRDGRRLAFASTQAGAWDVYVLDLETGETTQVTEHPAGDGSPSWLKDDRGLVFVSMRGGGNNVWRVDLTTRQETQLTNVGNNNFPSVSPSGDRVAWVIPERGVAIMDFQTGETVLSEGPSEPGFTPSWSPDGRFIAVTGTDWGSVDVYLVRADGNTHLLLTKNAAAQDRTWFDGHPAWSPDGKHIAVVSNHEGFHGVYLLSGLEAYLDRLVNPIGLATLDIERPPKQ
jgi:Tol biopolymer transport system component